MTYGWATLEGKTIAGVMKEFSAQTAIPDDVARATELLRDYVHARMQAHIAAGLDPPPPAGVDPLGFIVGGYDANGVGHLKRIYGPSGTIEDVATTLDPSAGWGGEIDVIVRTIIGYDALRLDVTGWDPLVPAALQQLSYQVPFRWFSLQDAIDFASFVVRTTIDTQRFTDGTVATPGASPTCGGPLQIAAITSHERVSWVQRTKLRGDPRPIRAEGWQEE